MTLNLVIGSLLGVSGKGSFLPKWGYTGRDDAFLFLDAIMSEYSTWRDCRDGAVLTGDSR